MENVNKYVANERDLDIIKEENRRIQKEHD
jgi:hypothetical protein